MRKILYIIPLIIFSFTFTGGPPQGWYQQFMPDLGGRQISDIFFLDSLTGWAVTAYIDTEDTAYVVKTTNGGDNWQITHTRTGGVGFKRIYFLNPLTGFASGANDFNNYSGLSKSTDGGINWISLNVPDPFVQFDDMYVLSEDTIWLAASSSITGGVFRTTNGGVNWVQQGSFGSQNPTKIYMIDGNTGFISSNSVLRKTTNGGNNWSIIPGENGFLDMEFANALTGWKSINTDTVMRKTTDGGNNWTSQYLPPTQGSSGIFDSRVIRFSVVNEDTLWAVGGFYQYGTGTGNFRGMIYKTTNGGLNWGYQIPDTSIHISSYRYIEFIDTDRGWAYSLTMGGVHTITGGGDTTIYTSIEQLTTEIPNSFRLYQNYPNPFNPTTKIQFALPTDGKVQLVIYDILGREVAKLVNDEFRTAGRYVSEFNGSRLSCGVYFYRISVNDGKAFDMVKKMVLVK